jgi:hypothetical protein
MSWALLILFLIGIGLFLRRASKGPARTVETLEWPIRGLLKQGFNGGFLVITVDGSNKFLQLDKYIRAPGDYGIELAFPKAEWSLQYYDRLLTFCESHAIPYRLSSSSPMDPLEFLFIDFGRDYVRANDIVKKILMTVLEVPKDNRVYFQLENASPEDRLVDS